MFQPKDPSRTPVPVLLYVATPSSPHWLGHAAEEDIADQVNFYVKLLNLAFLRKHDSSKMIT